jgi:hypothetical protein
MTRASAILAVLLFAAGAAGQTTLPSPTAEAQAALTRSEQATSAIARFLALQREADALHAAREAAYAAEIAAVRDDALGDWRPTPPAPPVTTKTVEVHSLAELNAALDSGTHYVLLPGDYTFATERAVMVRQSDVVFEAKPGVVIEHTGTTDARAFELKGSRVVFSGLTFRGDRLNAIYAVQHAASDTCDDVLVVGCTFETDQGVVAAGGQARWEVAGNTFRTRSYGVYTGFHQEQHNPDLHVHHNAYAARASDSHALRHYGLDGARVAYNDVEAPGQRSALSLRGGRNVVVEGNRLHGFVYVGPEDKDKVPGIDGVRFRNNTVVLPERSPIGGPGAGFTLERGATGVRVTFNTVTSYAPAYLFRVDGKDPREVSGTIAYNRLLARPGVPVLNRTERLDVRDNRVTATTQPVTP